MVARENPLVVRVTVNRWWGELFGQGLVASRGFWCQRRRTDAPCSAGLVSLRIHGQRLVAQKIVEDDRHVQHVSTSIHHFAQCGMLDPANVLLARGPNLRMDAEMIRDNALAISGLLSLKQSGPSIRPYQPAGVWNKVGGTAYSYEVSSDGDQYRRGIY